MIIELLAGRPDEIYHVTVMPCYDKKLEASRDDFVFQVEYAGEIAASVTEVDSVLTSGEVLELIQVGRRIVVVYCIYYSHHLKNNGK